MRKFFFPLLIASAVIVLPVLLFYLKKRIWAFIERSPKEISAGEAEAIIISTEQAGLYINSIPEIKVLMQVMPDKGRNFITEIKEVVALNELSRYKSGSRIKVKYLSGDDQKFII